MTPLTAEKIAELERLLAAARVLPWETGGESDPLAILCATDWVQVAVANEAFTDAPQNAALIAAAVNALPALLSLAKRVAGAPVACIHDVMDDGDSPMISAAMEAGYYDGKRVALVEIVGGEE